MDDKIKRTHSWQGKNLRVEILYTRAGVAQQIWVGSAETSIIVDCGDGVLRDLLIQQIEPNNISAAFFTHGHFDHMGGLYSLLGFLRMIGRTEPLPIYLPEGCTEVKASATAFQDCYRNSTPFAIELNELSAGQIVEIDRLVVKAYPVVHCGSIEGSEVLDPIPAMGYRISCKGESVAISGDTGLCETLKELVKDADLAVIEATFEHSKGKSRRLLENVHLSEDIATEVSKLARDYILIHKGRR